MKIKEKIQLSAEEFDEKFGKNLYKNTTGKEYPIANGGVSNSYVLNCNSNVKDFLITSQKELAKEIIEEFRGEIEMYLPDVSKKYPSERRQGEIARYNKKTRYLNVGS